MTKNTSMMEKQKIIIHPGEILREDFLTPLKLTAEKLATDIKVNPETIEELVNEKKDLDKELATRLAIYFEMSTNFWLDIQHDYEQDCLENLRTNLRRK
jgi:antitoxin HigA-1